MIAIEGLDKCGKSTVAGALMHLLPTWGYRHFRKSPMASTYDYYTMSLCDARPQLICDRLHWSEEAYGTVYRGSSDFLRIEYMKMELICLALGAHVLYLEDDIEAIRSRWGDDKEFPQAGIEGLVQEFETAIASTKLPYTRGKLPDLVSWDHHSREALAEFVGPAVKSAERAAMCPPPSMGVGDLCAATFFVVGPSVLPGKCSDVQFPLSLGAGEEVFWGCLSRRPWHKGYYCSAASYGTAMFQRLAMARNNEEKYLPPVITLGQEAMLEVGGTKKMIGDQVIFSLDHPSRYTHQPSALDRWHVDLCDVLDLVGARN